MTSFAIGRKVLPENSQKKVQSVDVINNEIRFSTGGDLVVYLREPIDNTDAEVHLTVIPDLTGAKLGDRLFLLVRTKTENNNVVLTFPNNLFYLTACGGRNSQLGVNRERTNINFIYDSEKFVNTLDNC